MVVELSLDEIESPGFLDTLYDLLASSYRRDTLQYLTSHQQPVSVHRLALELAAIEHGIAPEEVGSDQQEAVSLLLQHVHLPKLHDSGVLVWDRGENSLTLTPFLDHLSLAVPPLGTALEQALSHHLEST